MEFRSVQELPFELTKVCPRRAVAVLEYPEKGYSTGMGPRYPGVVSFTTTEKLPGGMGWGAKETV
jgi:hypothetical protein